MLVLTRHVHQSIVIGHDVIVTVLEVRGDQVRLGITAPKDIQVHREEVFAALTAANRQAATSASELEVLKELSSEPIASSKDGPRQRPGTSAGAPPSPRRGPGLASPTNPDSGPGQQSTTRPGLGPSVGHRARFGPLGKRFDSQLAVRPIYQRFADSQPHRREPNRSGPARPVRVEIVQLVHEGFTYGAGPISFDFGATLVYRRRRSSNAAGALWYGSAWWTLGTVRERL